MGTCSCCCRQMCPPAPLVAQMEVHNLPLPEVPEYLNAGAHEASERPISGLQTTNLIAATSYAEESREWFYYTSAAAGAQAATAAGGEEGRVGPISKAEVRQLHRWADHRPGSFLLHKGRMPHCPACLFRATQASQCIAGISAPIGTSRSPCHAALALLMAPRPSGRRAWLSRCPWPPSGSCGGGWRAR